MNKKNKERIFKWRIKKIEVFDKKYMVKWRIICYKVNF